MGDRGTPLEQGARYVEPPGCAEPTEDMKALVREALDLIVLDHLDVAESANAGLGDLVAKALRRAKAHGYFVGSSHPGDEAEVNRRFNELKRHNLSRLKRDMEP